MIWNNVELFNVEDIDERNDGAIRLLRFPKNVTNVFGVGKLIYPMTVGRMTTGCEIRFVTEAADIILSAEDADGVVEIYRGDFLCRTMTLKAGTVTRIPFRHQQYFSDADISGVKGRFSSDVWRVVFAWDYSVVIHDINPIREIRPPRPDEVPEKKILAYGSSITQGTCSGPHSNSYLSRIGRILGADTLCKGMGGSCFCEKEVADYIPTVDWDVAILELAVNMVPRFDVEVFRERAAYVVEKALTKNKPVVLISHFRHFNDLPGAANGEKNESYIKCCEEMYNTLKCENLYYISGREIVSDFTYLTSDLIHPSPFGHGEIGRKIADKLHNDFKII